MNHVIMIGFMGAGKTTIGKKIAKRLEREFIDTDQWIEEKTGRIIADIFAEDGEDAFRRLETETLRELENRQAPCVIAVGGGLPMQPENRPILARMGTVVFLEAGTDTLVERLKNDKTRPKLQGGDLRQRILDLMAEREAVYCDVADLRVSTDHRGYREVVEEIVSLLREPASSYTKQTSGSAD